MKLFNVIVSSTFDASYEGEIERESTRLVFANSIEEAKEFVSEHLPRDMYGYTFNVKGAYVVDSTKGDRLRKTAFYKP